jgi:hypothetical protein
LKRSLRFAALLAPLLTPPSSLAQESSLAGSWQGFVTANGMPLTVNLVIGPGQRYSQQLASGALMTRQTGAYAVAGQEIVFEVQDWQPRTQAVYHATSATTGYYAQEPVAKPSGGTFRFQFASPNALTLQDVNLGGGISFNRVQ